MNKIVAAFYETYGVVEGDALYRSAEERIRIWQ
jgi:predicted metalloendopeptidase